MDDSLKAADLVKNGEMVRFFWSDGRTRREVGIHSYDLAAGEMVSSESLSRNDARLRWSRMIRFGWTRLT